MQSCHYLHVSYKHSKRVFVLGHAPCMPLWQGDYLQIGQLYFYPLMLVICVVTPSDM
jgi:hypothetical protein